ncbi:MAG TPA: peptidylprolyl isomerase [Anaeromyxobacteraceae bacterium]|nr:peptidylprolyl isomerase [Anaeromyxobacteraceae bacterium]
MKTTIAAALLLALGAGCATARHGALARVNDELVTGDALRREFGRHHYAMEKILGDEREVRKYLDRLVDRRLFVQEGYRLGLDEAPEVREAVARTRAQKLVEAWVKEEIEARAAVSDEEVRAVHRGLTEHLEVRQVVVATRAEAEAARAAVAAGADLEALARERSTAESARRGGLLLVGWGAEEAYERALAGLKDGELTAPFQSPLGWEVMRLEQKKAVEPPTYEKVAPRIRQVLQRRKRAAAEREAYGALWARYDARVVDCAPTVEALRRAAAGEAPATCATWKGGALTEAALAKRLKLDELPQAADRWPELRQAVLEDLVARELAALDAEARGLGARPEVAAAVRARQDDLVEAKLYREQVIKGLEVGDEEARRWFGAHETELAEDARLELAQIVVATPEAAREVAQKLAAGQPFAELAASASTDARTAAEGGRLGFVEKKRLTGPFAPVASLGEGEVSAPIATKEGQHLVKVLSVRPARPRPFEEVADEVRRRALEEKQEAAVARWVKTLRASARIEVDDDAIRAYGRERLEALRRDGTQ